MNDSLPSEKAITPGSPPDLLTMIENLCEHGPVTIECSKLIGVTVNGKDAKGKKFSTFTGSISGLPSLISDKL